MTNSERFFEAHKTAKQIRSCFSTYRDAFAFALMEVYAMERTHEEEKTTAEKLEAVFGLVIGRYNSGNISSASLNGEGISNAKAYKLLGRGIWYDAATDSWMQKTELGIRELNTTLASSLRV